MLSTPTTCDQETIKMTDVMPPTESDDTGLDAAASGDPTHAVPTGTASADTGPADAESGDAESADREGEDRSATANSSKRSPLRRLMRYALGLGAAAGLVAGAIYAAPIVNDRLIQPVETNTADTAAIQTKLEEATTRIDQLETDAAGLRTDLDTVASDLATVDESVAANLTRLDDIDTLIAGQTTRLDDLDELAATLGTEVELQASTTALQIDFLKSTELLSRARLFLYQANYGLAQQDVQAARDLLNTLLEAQNNDSPVDTVTLASALSRIDLVIAALPDRPVAASDDLDIAWRLLLDEPLSPLLASSNPANPGSDPDAGATPPTTLEN